jgi:hypothetical protein
LVAIEIPLLFMECQAFILWISLEVITILKVKCWESEDDFKYGFVKMEQALEDWYVKLITNTNGYSSGLLAILMEEKE